MLRIRQLLQDAYAPATANRMLSALRGVLKNCWHARMVSAKGYQSAIDVPFPLSADPTTVGGLIEQFSRGNARPAIEDGLITQAHLPSANDVANPWIRLFQRVHDQYEPGEPFDNRRCTECAAAGLFVQALRQGGRNPTRSLIVSAIDHGAVNPAPASSACSSAPTTTTDTRACRSAASGTARWSSRDRPTWRARAARGRPVRSELGPTRGAGMKARSSRDLAQELGRDGFRGDPEWHFRVSPDVQAPAGV